MNWISATAIYALFWVLSAFLVLPFGVRTHDEMGLPKRAGQADSAPGNFRPRRVIAATTLLSAVLFGLFYANYVNGWIGVEDIDITRWVGRPE